MTGSEHLLRCVHHIEVTIFVFIGAVNFRHCLRQRRHHTLIDQQEERLVRVKLESSADSSEKVAEGKVVRNQKFRPVKTREPLFIIVALDNARDLIIILVKNVFDVALSLG